MESFFSFCYSYFDLSHDFHAQYCFHSHLIFTAHTSLGCRNVFDRKPDTLLSWTLYRIRVTAHVILKVREEDVMNDSLLHHLSDYRERETDSKLSGISNKTISRIECSPRASEAMKRQDGA